MPARGRGIAVGAPRASPRSTGKGRGFSLLELMVVLSLLAILSAMIVPQFASGYQDAILRAAGREVLSVMNLAYSEAVSLHRPHRLRFDVSEGRYWLEARREGDPEGFAPARGVPGSSGRLDRRISIFLKRPSEPDPLEARDITAQEPSGSGDAVLFRPDGTAEAREILLRDRDGFGLSLGIDPVTARVRLRDLEKEPLP